MRKKPKKFTLEEILPKYTLEDVLPDKEANEDNLAKIDARLDGLEKYLGRELTEDEEMAILDIVDEYTPKDKKGNYLVPLIPFDYAWKIYEAMKENGKTG